MAKTAKEQGISLHLALNGKIHLMGNINGKEPRDIRLNDLLIQEDILLDEWSVGESPNHYGGTIGSNGLFDVEILKQWTLELKK